MADHEDHDHHPHERTAGRTTAPQSDYSLRDVAIGVVIAAVGIAVTFAIPIVGTL